MSGSNLIRHNNISEAIIAASDAWFNYTRRGQPYAAAIGERLPLAMYLSATLSVRQFRAALAEALSYRLRSWQTLEDGAAKTRDLYW